jgi:hypothetical protein
MPARTACFKPIDYRHKTRDAQRVDLEHPRAGRNADLARGLSMSGDQADAFLRQLDRIYRARQSRGGY